MQRSTNRKASEMTKHDWEGFENQVAAIWNSQRVEGCFEERPILIISFTSVRNSALQQTMTMNSPGNETIIRLYVSLTAGKC